MMIKSAGDTKLGVANTLEKKGMIIKCLDGVEE